MKKPTLAEAVKRRYFELGTNSHRLFRELGVANDEAINVWLRKNRFKTSYIASFMRLLGMPEDIEELQKEFDFDVYGGFSNFSGFTGGSHEDILPLIKTVAQSDVKQISFADLNFLLDVQAKIKMPITVALTQELVRIRHAEG